jgi:tetratricopeptide (TPR) repeat protein
MSMANEHQGALGFPGEARDAFEQGLLELARERPEAAQQIAAGVLQSDPHALLELGRLLVRIGRCDEAIGILDLAVARSPDMTELVVQLGYAKLSCRNCAGARIAFARALQLSPGTPDALFGIAKVHQELGESEPAANYFRDYLSVRPGDCGAWLNLGHCLLELGRREEGYECFRRAARGEAGRYGTALTSLVAAGHGRFWLRPSDAAAFFRLPQD